MRVTSQAVRLEHALSTLPEAYPGLEALKRNAVYLLGCRTFRQFCRTFRSIADSERFCLFCNPDLADNKPSLKEGGWYAKLNDFAYPNHDHHWVLFPKRHLIGYGELGDQDAIDRFRLEQQLCRKFNVQGYVSVMRAGHPKHTGATVPHAHAHWQVPNGEGKALAYFAKDREHLLEDYARTKRFVQLIRDSGGLAWLMNPETVITEPA